jgi:hypothetical protein
MNLLNTHWTFEYLAMIIFVFVSAWMISIRFTVWWYGDLGYKWSGRILSYGWAVLATFFFHQWW